ncbi:hypothetical protein BC830DRAFT_854309 [Chytriomyces sp. MP71]|nr:hypothetical protein BC830DRAFT_854309 [Chytriomyces sp. MP71]
MLLKAVLSTAALTATVLSAAVSRDALPVPNRLQFVKKNSTDEAPVIAASGTHLKNYGGPVIKNVEVHPIFYSPSPPGTISSLNTTWAAELLFLAFLCQLSSQPYSVMNNTFSVSSHELEEAATDAAVGVVQNIGFPLAWYDQNIGEIGDICNAEQGKTVGKDGKTYVFQTQWSKAANTCVAAGTVHKPSKTTGKPSKTT